MKGWKNWDCFMLLCNRWFLGTFDIKTALVNNISPGAVNVICTFTTNSQALGCLVVLHPWNKTQTEIFAYAARDNRHVPTVNITIHGVPRGNYTVLVFDGEYNGLLSERAATAPQNITVTDGGLEPVVGNLLSSHTSLTHYMMSITMQYIITTSFKQNSNTQHLEK